MENSVETVIKIVNKIYSVNQEILFEFITDLKEILCNIKDDKIFKKIENIIANMNKFIKDYKKRINSLNNTFKDSIDKKGNLKKQELIYENGKYFGETLNGIEEGRGVFNYKNGDIYDGDWKKGKKEGKGTYIFKSGGVYEGEMKDDNIEGKGIFYYSNGDIYEGNFSDYTRHGKGICYYTDGERYEGDWRGGVKHGQGITYLPNGDREMGNYFSDSKKGKHVTLTLSGEVFSEDYK